MPTYNASRYLASSIDSILSQTYQHLELLITDDCSTDPKTLDILADYQRRDHRVKVFHLRSNQGPGVARNHSIERARGRYIAFCDSDDRWKPTKIERQILFMQERRCALCSTSYIICDKDGKVCGINLSPEHISMGMMRRDNKIGCLTAIYDTQLLGRKYYFPTLRKRQDWGLFLTIMQDCHEAYALREPLAYYRLRSNSLSSHKLSLVRYNVLVYRKILGYSRARALACFFFLFMPTYIVKQLKIKRDSRKYIGTGGSQDVFA